MNLGPQLLLEPLMKTVYEMDKKEYLYKLTSTGVFAIRGLKEYELGAAIRGRRKAEEEASRFPKQFWTEELL